MIYKIKRWFLRKVQELISIAVGYDAVLIGSEIRMLKCDIQCLRDNHDWQDWSATLAGNVEELKDPLKRYSFRACRHCRVEMPESRIWLDTGIKEKNTKEFLNKTV